MQGKGELLYEYHPIPANPLLLALLLVVALVTFVIAPLLSPSDLFPLGGLCFLPVILLLAMLLVGLPSPARVWSEGIEISLPLYRRVLGKRSYHPFAQISNIYPASYEVTGTFMSPFASSAGTLVHLGIGFETIDGKRLLMRFTPATLRSFRGESRGFVETLETIRGVYAGRGVLLVTRCNHYSEQELKSMHEEATAPLVSVNTTIFAFLGAPAVVALVFFIADYTGLEISGLLMTLVVFLSSIPPGLAIYKTYERSKRRNFLLTEIAKFREFVRQGNR